MTGWLIPLAVGAATGVLSGFGVGGGTLLLVYLTAVAGVDQHLAQGINLLYFLPAGLLALPALRLLVLLFARLGERHIRRRLCLHTAALVLAYMGGAWLFCFLSGDMAFLADCQQALPALLLIRVYRRRPLAQLGTAIAASFVIGAALALLLTSWLDVTAGANIWLLAVALTAGLAALDLPSGSTPQPVAAA